MKNQKKVKGLGQTKITRRDSLITVATVINDDKLDINKPLLSLISTLEKSFKFFEILLIDNTAGHFQVETIRKLQKKYPFIRALILSQQYDREIAYMAILENCIGDYVVLSDINSDQTKIIPQLINKAIFGYDIVTAKPQPAPQCGRVEVFFYKIFNIIAIRLLNFEVSPNDSYFLVFSRRAVNAIIRFRNKHRYLKYLSYITGLKQTAFDYKTGGKSTGVKKRRNIFQSFFLAADIIISNTTFPLRLAAMIGMLASLISLSYIGYVFIVALVKKKVAEGWITTSILSASMFFLLFLILVILSEYIDRLASETKDQPMYIISEELTNSDFSFLKDKINVK